MQPLGIPEWLLSITLGVSIRNKPASGGAKLAELCCHIDNLLRCHRLLTPGPKARLFLQKAAQCFKATNRKEAIAVLRQFHNRSEKVNESNGEKRNGKR